MVLSLLVGTSLAVAGQSAAGADAGSKTAVSVGRRTVTLVDTSRPTPANGTSAGAPDRTLETVVSYPKRGNKSLEGPLPLVVFATGFGGTSTNYAPLYDHWVRAGYVVVAPTFPLSSEDAPGGTTIADAGSQAGDVRFVIDEMIRLSSSRRSKLRQLIDPDRIAIAGKSLGAITVLNAGYLVADHETRIKAVIALTGGVGDGPEHFQGIDTPLLLEHGDADTTVPISGSQTAFANASPPKFFVTLFGHTHGSAFGGGDDPAEQVVHATTVDFLDAYLEGDDAARLRLYRDGTVADVAALQAEA